MTIQLSANPGMQVVATSGGSIARFAIAEGSLRYLKTFVGYGETDHSRENRTGTGPEHPMTAAADAVAFGAAVTSACARLALEYPGVKPPELSDLLLSRQYYCNGTLRVHIDVYQFQPKDELSELLAGFAGAV